ncbi:MAG: ribosome silencing factor [Tissierellaceae bacterium]
MKEVEQKLAIITKACEDKNGIDIKTLDIRNLTSIADYFVIVSGNSSTQSQGIANEIEDKMMESGFERISKDGYQSGRWILLDFGDIIVHIFHKDERDYYDLERLWTKDID